jgi:hypothetical protein
MADRDAPVFNVSTGGQDPTRRAVERRSARAPEGGIPPGRGPDPPGGGGGSQSPPPPRVPTRNRGGPPPPPDQPTNGSDDDDDGDDDDNDPPVIWGPHPPEGPAPPTPPSSDDDDDRPPHRSSRRRSPSDDRRFLAPRATETDIKHLKAFPDAGSFPEWRRGFYLNAIAASGRGDRCAAWLRATNERTATPEMFMTVDPSWQSFDARLAVALKAIVTGPLALRIARAIDEAIDEGRTATGRSMLCRFFQFFEPNGRQFNTDALQDVYDLVNRHHTLDSTEKYMCHLDSLLLRCVGEQPSPDTMTCRFHRQICNVPELLWDMQAYDRMPDSHPDRCYRWLREQVDRAIVVHRAAMHRKDFARTLTGTGRGAAAPIADKKKARKGKRAACGRRTAPAVLGTVASSRTPR